jgi:hypothetical protein
MLSTMIAPRYPRPPHPDSGKVVTVNAKGEPISLTRYGEPAEYWDDAS